VDIVKLDRSSLRYEYGLDTQRLMPWPVLNAPFEAAWCVVRPGTTSNPHSHDEYEIFVATSGHALVEIDGDRHPFEVGDVAHFRPGSVHCVVNDSHRPFEFYSVWWDEEMTQRFAARHRGEG
jgi:mannose-6-phosphate isomerase-like protein (cupin superfamily)